MEVCFLMGRRQGMALSSAGSWAAMAGRSSSSVWGEPPAVFAPGQVRSVVAGVIRYRATFGSQIRRSGW